MRDSRDRTLWEGEGLHRCGASCPASLADSPPPGFRSPSTMIVRRITTAEDGQHVVAYSWQPRGRGGDLARDLQLGTAGAGGDRVERDPEDPFPDRRNPDPGSVRD